ncbi:hypothetical protein [Paenibacillus sp. FSL R5-0486]|uniref:hypothetical protein n=1 Tax=Paenibacillus sp. FSL R5-0486 TaxID=2921645 RepID=UPI0030D84E36
MVIVKTNLQESDGSSESWNDHEFELNEAQVAALLSSDLIEYPRAHPTGISSVTAKLIGKEFSLYNFKKPHWKLTFRLVE